MDELEKIMQVIAIISMTILASIGLWTLIAMAQGKRLR